MSDHKVLCNLLKGIFNVNEWSNTQYTTYKSIQQIANEFKEHKRMFETKDDLIIIRSNLKEQLWYKYSKSKPIISHLLDTMKLLNHTYEHNLHCINFTLSLQFDKFEVHACLYKNLINNVTIYYIYLENKQKRAYVASYMKPVETKSKNINKLPEFDKIYEITSMSQNIICQCDLLNLFAEIIMYYDDSTTIGTMPISHEVNVTLNQLIEKSNQYLSKKVSSVDYNWNT